MKDVPGESHQEREERVDARAGEFKRGLESEEQFRAYLFGMRYRGEDVRHKLNDNAPAPRVDFEATRYQASLEWLREFLSRC